MKKIILLGILTVCILGLIPSCGFFSRKSNSPGPVIGTGTSKQKVVKFEVIGKGLDPETSLTRGEAVLMAERAAISDGYRQLVEKIRGVYVEAYTKSGNGTVDYDLVNTHTQSWLRGVKILQLTRGEYGITHARMQLSINFTKRDMIWWPIGLGDGV